MRGIWIVALLAGVGCQHVGVRGFAAQKADWNTGGTILYGVIPCDTRIEKPCYPVAQYDPAGNAKSQRLAQADADRELESLKSACPRGWVIEERSVAGWVKAAYPTGPVPVPETATGTVLIYRCQ